MKCIEDEIPFEIPDGWAWARLSSISEAISDGDHQPPPQTASGIPFLVITNVSDGRLCFENTRFVSQEYFDSLSDTRKPQKGDVLFTVTGSYGIPILIESNVEFCFQRHIAIIRPCLASCEYIYVLLGSAHIKAICDNRATGVAQKTVSLTTLRDLLVPIAPYAEQLRIFARTQVAITRINDITSAEEDLRDLINTAKSKILDLAIRGQLVPQNPDDEPASVLLDRIRAEKEELIKQSKIKRDKKESFIFKGEDNSYYEKVGNETTCIDDLLPFEIPDNWGWVRMKEVCIINPRNNVSDDTEVSFIPMPLIQEGFANSHSSESRMWAQVKTGFTHFREYDVGVAKITPCFENRKSVVFHNLKNGIGAGTTELHILRPKADAIIPEYILAILKTNSFITGGVQTFSSAVGQQRINKDYVAEYLIPLPPHGEQRRICDKVAHVLDMLSTIETSLS